MKSLRTILIITVSTVVLLEVVLQLLSFSVWLLFSGEAGRTGYTANRVLCIGDSFTYGLGASSPEGTYPAAMQRGLRSELGSDWEVVNRGMPGRNSRQLLERFDGFLADAEPRFVCIIGFVNDGWSRPEPHLLPPFDPEALPEADGGSFEWTWRTLRLLSTLRASDPFRGDEARAPPNREKRLAELPAALLGEWSIESTHLTISLDANGTAAVGPDIVAWSADDRRLHIGGGDAPRIEGLWRLDGGRLLITTGDGTHEVTLSRTGSSGSRAAARGFRALRNKDYQAAKACFVESLDRIDWQSSTRSSRLVGLIRAHRELGEIDEARALVEHVRSVHEAVGSDRAWGNYVEALSIVGRTDDAYAEAQALVELHPDSLAGWTIIAREAAHRDELDLAKVAVERALDLNDRIRGDATSLLKTKAQIFKDENPRIVTECLVRAFLATPDERLARQSFMAHHNQVTEQRLIEVCEQLMIPAGERESLLRIHALANGDRNDPAVIATLAGHLRQFVMRSREAGATPIFGTYPWSGQTPYYAAMRDVADELEVALVRVDEEFARVKQQDPEADLFVSDGHCNDAGYAIMGQTLADFVVRRVRARTPTEER